MPQNILFANSWIIDSGATHHKIARWFTSHCSRCWGFKISPSFILTNVLNVQIYPLILCLQINSHNIDCKVTLSSHLLCISGPGTTMGRAKEKDGLYYSEAP